MPELCWFDEQVKQIKSKCNGYHKTFLANISGHEVVPQQDDCTFRTFHNTELSNMLSIFQDGYMRFGQWHGDGVGVYMYSYNSVECMTPDEAMIELRVVPYLSKLAHGSKARYVMRAPVHGEDSSDKGNMLGR